MATVRPFRALRYNTRDPLSVALVTAPPYDCIAPAERDELYRTHPHNIVRLTLTRDEPGDGDRADKYARAADLLEKWANGGILSRDDEPALYVYQQAFELEGQQCLREGFLARVGLEPLGEGDVYPHEETMPGPKEDRLRLLRATRANLEPIFGLFPDADHAVAERLHEAGLGEPVVQTVDGEGVIHRLFAVTDDVVLHRVAETMAPKPLYIADGHHRYETALAYRHELRAAGEAIEDDHPANSILMMCVSMHDPGLAVLPTHRVIEGLSDLTADALREATQAHFAWTEYTGAEATSPRMRDHLAKAGGHAFGLWTRDTSAAFVLELKDKKVMDRLASDHSKAWRRLDPAILSRVVIEHDLPEAVKDASRMGLRYVHLAQQAFDAVHEEGADAAFLLRPLPVWSLEAVAAEGERMPPKSTYFYPKILSGLVINPLSD